MKFCYRLIAEWLMIFRSQCSFPIQAEKDFHHLVMQIRISIWLSVNVHQALLSFLRAVERNSLGNGEDLGSQSDVILERPRIASHQSLSWRFTLEILCKHRPELIQQLCNSETATNTTIVSSSPFLGWHAVFKPSVHCLSRLRIEIKDKSLEKVVSRCLFPRRASKDIRDWNIHTALGVTELT